MSSISVPLCDKGLVLRHGPPRARVGRGEDLLGRDVGVAGPAPLRPVLAPQPPMPVGSPRQVRPRPRIVQRREAVPV
jgi:hypothetical protein